MSRRALVVILLASLAAAGCVNPSADSDSSEKVGRSSLLPLDWAVSALPSGEGHSHKDRAQHVGLSTPNFHVLGWDPLVTDELGTSAGAYYCGEIAETAEGRRLAVVNSFNTEVAFVVADVTDPARPFKVGEYILDRVHIYDSGLTPDGKYVVLAARPEQSRLATPPKTAASDLALPDFYSDDLPTVTIQPRWRDACTGEVRDAGPERTIPFFPGTLLVSLEDPANPTWADFKPTPLRGPHSVATSMVDGKTWVTASVTNTAHHAAYFAFYHVVDGPRGAMLDLQTVYQAPPTPATATMTNGHVDALVQKHPVTDQTLAYLANWGGGMVILDMANPRVPQRVSTWGQEHGIIHEAMPLDVLWEGRHYTITGQETGEPVDLPSGWVFILDTTDPANPVEVGRWTLPHKPKWDGGLQFSTHYVEIVNRTMFVSTYHGGVWAVDLSTMEKMADPHAIGVFLPDRVSPQPSPNADDAPETLDVLAFPDGTLVVYDAASGVYTLKFDETDPAPPARWQE